MDITTIVKPEGNSKLLTLSRISPKQVRANAIILITLKYLDFLKLYEVAKITIPVRIEKPKTKYFIVSMSIFKMSANVLTIWPVRDCGRFPVEVQEKLKRATSIRIPLKPLLAILCVVRRIFLF